MLKHFDTLIGFVVVMSLVSVLITITTQVVSAVLGLRGRNLADALEAMLHKIDPQINDRLEGGAKKLADAILTRPVISDSVLSMSKKWPISWKRASAIRPDELLHILRDIAASPRAAEPGPMDEMRVASGSISEKSPHSGIEPSSLRPVPSAILASLGDTAPAAATPTERLNVIDSANEALRNLEAWFNSAQDRARQWFAMHTRITTVCAAFIIAFVLQLDSMEVLRRVSSDPDVRTRLVASADAVHKEVNNVLQNSNAGDSAVQKELIEKLQKKYPVIDGKLDQAPQYTTLAAVDEWIRHQLAGTAQVEEIVSAYNQLFFEKNFDTTSKTLARLDTDLDNAGLQLLPSPYPEVFNRDPKRECWQLLSGKWSWPKRHLLGILMSVALLSLGAPFWFNMLKSLTNLRPMLAKEVEKDPKQIPEK
jgi:hypothetical protein